MVCIIDCKDELNMFCFYCLVLSPHNVLNGFVSVYQGRSVSVCEVICVSFQKASVNFTWLLVAEECLKLAGGLLQSCEV